MIETFWTWAPLWILIGGFVSVGTLDLIYNDRDDLFVFLGKCILALIFWPFWAAFIMAFSLWVVRRRILKNANSRRRFNLR